MSGHEQKFTGCGQSSQLNAIKDCAAAAGTGRRLEAQAAKQGKTVSGLIREVIEGNCPDEAETAGDWILSQAHKLLVGVRPSAQPKGISAGGPKTSPLR